MRRFLLISFAVLLAAAMLLTHFCGYWLIEHSREAAEIGPRTYKLETRQP